MGLPEIACQEAGWGGPDDRAGLSINQEGIRPQAADRLKDRPSLTHEQGERGNRQLFSSIFIRSCHCLAGRQAKRRWPNALHLAAFDRTGPGIEQSA